ncbi:MAG: hypothetical protein OEW67_00105 [Cyclobacteriaceae bacterium]|nr:hypothetical protein [Cyclobacteriaceae bacterium]
MRVTFHLNNKTIKIIYLLFLIIVIPFVANSQNSIDNRSSIYDGFSNASEWDYRLRDALTDLRYKANRVFTPFEEEQILGNSYYNKAFVLGKLLDNNKETKRNYLLRYNAFRDEIEIQVKDEIEYLVRHPDISCTIGEEKYMFQPYKTNENGTTMLGYLTVLYQGNNFTLLIRKVKQFKEEQKAKTSLSTSWPAKIEDITEFYFLDKTIDYALRINSKKKMFSKNISKSELSEMSTFIKQNHLKIKDKENLITIYKHYDSLNSDSNK